MVSTRISSIQSRANSNCYYRAHINIECVMRCHRRLTRHWSPFASLFSLYVHKYAYRIYTYTLWTGLMHVDWNTLCSRARMRHSYLLNIIMLDDLYMSSWLALRLEYGLTEGFGHGHPHIQTHKFLSPLLVSHLMSLELRWSMIRKNYIYMRNCRVCFEWWHTTIWQCNFCCAC